MPLEPRVVEARIVWRVALLRVLAAETFVRHAQRCPAVPQPVVTDRNLLPPPRRSRPGGDGH
jgi:hypothetical protein